MDLSAETIGAKTHQLKQDGYRQFKLKIGHKELQKDIDRVRAVRDAVGDEATIRVDGNATYSFTEAREILNALSRFHLFDAEQPLARGDLKSLAELRRTVGVSVAAQESVRSPQDALAVLDAGAADLLKIKLTHIGGFQTAMQVAAIVGAKDLPLVIGQGSACTPIHSAAEMHLHVALKDVQPGGEMTGFLRLGNRAMFSYFDVKLATMTPTNTTGLGITVNRENLAELATRDS